MLDLENSYLYIFISLICAACISFTMTPVARVIAFKIGAVDVPKDARRMHRVTMPLLGGVAIFTAFFITALAFWDFRDRIKKKRRYGRLGSVRP